MVHHNHFPAKTTKEPLQPPAHWLVAPQGHENPTRCHGINSRTGLYARTYAACLQSYSNTLALLLDRNASQPMLFNLMLELFIAVKQSKEPTSRSPERVCRFAGKKKQKIDVQMHSMTCGAAVPRPALDTGTPAAGPRKHRTGGISIKKFNWFSSQLFSKSDCLQYQICSKASHHNSLKPQPFNQFNSMLPPTCAAWTEAFANASECMCWRRNDHARRI